tara:strand:+ start:369 stop:659 length:291 start_codon:yes stop_codon:yes gene_type:complete
MANHMKCVDGVNIEMSDEEHAARVAEEKVWEDGKPARAFSGLRRERDQKLQETDYFALSDVSMSDEMTAYRKALRDLPASYNNSTVVGDITWPSKP